MQQILRGGLETSPDPATAVAVADTPGDLARDTAGQLQPRYVFVPRPAGRLACGELVAEPTLGTVRVADVRHESEHPFVHVAWTDDQGPCQAAGRYPIEQPFAVRAPDRADQLVIRQGIDQATWARRPIVAPVARLITAHVNPGPRSVLYRFAINGAVPDELHDELTQVAAHQPAYRQWVSALDRYCRSRDDPGPLPGWGPEPPIPAMLEPNIDGEEVRGRNDWSPEAGLPLPVEQLSAETALQLIDAAFALGVAAVRSETAMAKARQIIRQHAAALPT